MERHIEPLPGYLLFVIVSVAVIVSLCYLFGRQALSRRRFERIFSEQFAELGRQECGAVLLQNRKRLRRMVALRFNSEMQQHPSFNEVLALNKGGFNPTAALSLITRYFSHFPSSLLERFVPEAKFTPIDLGPSVEEAAAGLRESVRQSVSYESKLAADSNGMLPRMQAVWRQWLNVSQLPDEVHRALYSAIASERRV